jgi:hypothetical protein
MSIDALPDDVLLDIFDFYVSNAGVQEWQSLVHVCRRWRSVVFGSPSRLDLALFCTTRTPTRDTLDVWPALPLLIQVSFPGESLDNIVAVLERHDRVRKIYLMNISSLHMEELSAAMQLPFPELTDLSLSSHEEVVLPDSFLGGSAPRLRSLDLNGFPFPELPKLLLTSTHIVTLHLRSIPHSGYISPEAMFTALSTLTGLDSLVLEFRSPVSRPDRATRPPPPLTNSVLAVLNKFWFKGDSEYFDDLMAHIDAPRLGDLTLYFFNQVVFDTPQFNRFICRTPRLKAFKIAHVTFSGEFAKLFFFSPGPGLHHDFVHESLEVNISCRVLDWQVSSLEQLCTSCLPLLSTLEALHIFEGLFPPLEWQENIENALWLDLLRPFSAVTQIFLSEEFARRIIPALQELVGGRTTELLPNLQELHVEGLSGRVQEGIHKIVDERQTASHPISVSRWDRTSG